MRKLNFKIVSAILMLVLAVSFTSCSSESDDKDTELTENLFDKSKLKITITKTSNNPDTRRLTIDYEVTNIANIPYEFVDDGNYYIKFTVFATDGTKFEERVPMPSLSAGATKTQYGVVEFTEGKVLNLGSLTYEIVLV